MMNKLTLGALLFSAAMLVSGAPGKSKTYTVTADAEWHPLVYDMTKTVIPGSALDLSRDGVKPIERVVIRNGQFYRESEPDRPIRFYSTTLGFGFPYRIPVPFSRNLLDYLKGKITREQWREILRTHAKELRRRGFNMIRIERPFYSRGGIVRFNDEYFQHTLKLLIDGAEAQGKPLGEVEHYNPAELNPEYTKQIQDDLDFFYAECAKQGIWIHATLDNNPYLCLRWIEQFKKEPNQGFLLHYNEMARKDWIRAVDAYMNHVNPYTGFAVKDDPQVLFCIGYNEQDFAFLRPQDWTPLKEEWKKYTKSDIPAPSYRDYQKRGKNFDLIQKFIFHKESEITRFFHENLRKTGYKGYYANYDVACTMRYTELRKEGDLTVFHRYFDHPGDGGRAVAQRSVFQVNGNEYFNLSVGTKFRNSPMFIGEYDLCYPDKYRSQSPFLLSAYAAFQSFSGLTPWGSTVATTKSPYVSPFVHGEDPVAAAGDVQTYLMFMREDVSPAKNDIYLTYSPENLTSRMMENCIDAKQANLSLVSRVQLDDSQNGKPEAGAKNVQMAIPLKVGGRLVDANGGADGEIAPEGGSVSVVFDSTGKFDSNALLRSSGLIGKENRTNIPYVYESDTKELYYSKKERFMTVNTPRFQGFCTDFARKEKFRDIELETAVSPSALSASAYHKDSDLANDDRVLFIFTTNALGSNMVFEDKTMKKIIGGEVRDAWGTMPVLVRCGVFKFSLKNRNAAKMKLYALDFTGAHREEIPVTVSGDTVSAVVDTAKLKSPTVYFELVTEK